MTLDPKTWTRPLLVGESNPYGSSPEFALYPSPRGCSGERLCRLVLGFDDPDEYLNLFDRVNLCDGAWNEKAARERAASILTGPKRVILMLGAKVTRAFGFGNFTPFIVRPHPTHRLVCFPHPSGLARAWGEPGAFGRAREFLREVGGIPLGDDP